VEVETALRFHLMNQPAIRGVVGKNVWKFRVRLRDDDGKPRGLAGTGLAGIVIRRQGSWTKPHRNTGEFPLMVVDCMADDPRDPLGDPLSDSMDERALQVYREVDRVLHQVDGEHRYWPEGKADALYVEGCYRGSDPTAPTLIDGVAVVRATYDVKCFH
jgi:hypothetical protein